MVRLGHLLGEDHRRSVLDRPVVERRELGARQLDQLDPVGLRESPRRNDLVDLQGDRTAFFRVELRVDDRPVRVPLAVADAVRIAVEPDDGLDGIPSRLRARSSGPGKPSARESIRSGSPGFQSSTSTAKNGWGRNQSGPSRGSARRSVRAEHHINARRDRLAPHRAGAGDLEGQPLRLGIDPSLVAERAGVRFPAMHRDAIRSVKTRRPRGSRESTRGLSSSGPGRSSDRIRLPGRRLGRRGSDGHQQVRRGRDRGVAARARDEIIRLRHGRSSSSGTGRSG